MPSMLTSNTRWIRLCWGRAFFDCEWLAAESSSGATATAAASRDASRDFMVPPIENSRNVIQRSLSRDKQAVKKLRGGRLPQLSQSSNMAETPGAPGLAIFETRVASLGEGLGFAE